MSESILNKLWFDPLLMESMYLPFRVQRDRFAANLARIAESGAAQRNAEFERAEHPTWYVEQQRYTCELVAAAIALDEPGLLDPATKGLQWAFDRQAADGSFAGTSDLYHSTDLFVESTARALLLLRDSDLRGSEELLERFTDPTHAAAKWMMSPGAEESRKHDRPFTHRKYITAAATGFTAALTHDSQLEAFAADFAHAGLRLQQADGINPEKGGFDVNYQSAGTLYALKYWSVCPDAALRDAIAQMARRALPRVVEKIDAGGEVSSEGSSRMGKEVGRSGTIKRPNHKEIVRVLVCGSIATGEPIYRDVAQRIIRRADWIDEITRLFPNMPD